MVIQLPQGAVCLTGRLLTIARGQVFGQDSLGYPFVFIYT